jgi:hypothetical protein
MLDNAGMWRRRASRLFPAVLALAGTLGLAGFLVSAQPYRAAWWSHADADAVYTASALNILAGRGTVYDDHPGLPLQQLLAAAFGVELGIETLTQRRLDRTEFADERLLALDRTRVVYRSLAIALYLAAAAAACVVGARLMGGWRWGLAAGLLWVGSPNLTPMSIQYRPDPAFSGLMLVFAYFAWRAVERRGARELVLAAVVAGFATSVKVHAVALIVPLALATLFVRVRPEWAIAVRRRASELWHRGGAVLVVLALGLVALTGATDIPRLSATEAIAVCLFGALAAILPATIAVVARRRLDAQPGRVASVALVVGGFALGLLVPVVIGGRDGAAALVAIGRTALGGGVNSDISFFESASSVFGLQLRQTVVVVGLAGIAAVVGLRSRDYRPAVLFAGSVSLAALAAGRLGTPHYFAPTFALALLPVLWLARRTSPVGPALLALLVVWVVGVQVRYRDGSATTLAATEAAVAEPLARALDRLEPGEVVLTPSEHLNFPAPDTQYFEFVRAYATYTPARRYRSLPASANGLAFLEARGLRAAFYVGPPISDLEQAPTARIVPGTPAIVYRIVDGRLGPRAR